VLSTFGPINISARFYQAKGKVKIMVEPFNPKEFRRNLLEAATWCSRSDTNLRTVILTVPDYFTLLSLDDREHFINNVFQERRKLLGEQSVDSNSVENGRLLVFYPDCTFALDGVTQIISQGFFDYDNYPAFDTWVYYGVHESRSNGHPSVFYLISWVPSRVIQNVNEALLSNADESLFWIDDARNEFDFQFIYSESAS
jgi:hypothetical protein